MSERESLPTRLHQACVGTPAASIPWPHRILHEAADEIERLQALLSARSNGQETAAPPAPAAEPLTNRLADLLHELVENEAGADAALENADLRKRIFDALSEHEARNGEQHG